jgi:cell division protein FtsI/penicillin-binding protein 2
MMKNPHPSRRRVYVLLGFFCAFLVLFFAVLYDAQVVHGSENRARSITSNTASETVTASRGIITDRNGKVLVSNRLAYTLVVDKSSFGKDEAALNEALRSGEIAGAGIDAFVTEPPISSPLLELEQVIAAPHVAGSSMDSINNMGIFSARNVVKGFAELEEKKA